jgi:hypothetical protein
MQRQFISAICDVPDIRHDDINSRRGVVAEHDAEIDHQPFSGMAIEIEIHPDLAGAAERQEVEAVVADRVHRVGVFATSLRWRGRATASRPA